MKRHCFGDIVLLKFPFTDGKTFKKRPALVIRNTNDGDIIVVRITSQLFNTEFDLFVERWKISGLKLPSVIRLHKIATLENTMVDLKLGEIDNELADQVKKTFNKLSG
jgi:mRNA interferase MazF